MCKKATRWLLPLLLLTLAVMMAATAQAEPDVKKQLPMKGSRFLARPAGFDFACGRSPFAALTAHRAVIHHRSVRIPWTQKTTPHEGESFFWRAPRDSNPRPFDS